MRTLWESLLDSDTKISQTTRQVADIQRYLDTYLSFIINLFGKHINKKWGSGTSGRTFCFTLDSKDLDKWKKLKEKRPRGFRIELLNSNLCYFYLDKTNLAFKWILQYCNLFVRISKIFGNSFDKQLEEYAADTLKNKLLK